MQAMFSLFLILLARQTDGQYTGRRGGIIVAAVTDIFALDAFFYQFPNVQTPSSSFLLIILIYITRENLLLGLPSDMSSLT